MTTIEPADASPPTREIPGDPGTLLFENDRVRVWELIMKPGEVCNWHRHDTDHLLVVIDGSDVGAEFADGRVVDINLPDNRVVFVPRGRQSEVAWNTSIDRTLRELIIDFKDVDTATEVKRSSQMFGFFQPDTPTTTRPATP